MHRRRSQQGRYCRHAGVHAPVRQHQNVGAVADGPPGVDADGFDGRFHGFRAAVHRIQHGQGHGPQLVCLQVLDDRHLPVGQDGTQHFQGRRAFFIRFHDVGHVADHDTGGRNDTFPHAVYGRVRHLGEILLEIIIEHLGFFRKHRQGRVDAHGAYRVLAHTGHGDDHLGQVFLGVTEDLLLFFQIKGNQRIVDHAAPFFHQLIHFDDVLFAPFAVRMGCGQHMFDLIVSHDTLLRRVDQEQAARLQTSLISDLFRGNRHRAGFRA